MPQSHRQGDYLRPWKTIVDVFFHFQKACNMTRWIGDEMYKSTQQSHHTTSWRRVMQKIYQNVKVQCESQRLETTDGTTVQHRYTIAKRSKANCNIKSDHVQWCELWYHSLDSLPQVVPAWCDLRRSTAMQGDVRRYWYHLWYHYR